MLENLFFKLSCVFKKPNFLKSDTLTKFNFGKVQLQLDPGFFLEIKDNSDYSFVQVVKITMETQYGTFQFYNLAEELKKLYRSRFKGWQEQLSRDGRKIYSLRELNTLFPWSDALANERPTVYLTKGKININVLEILPHELPKEILLLNSNYSDLVVCVDFDEVADSLSPEFCCLVLVQTGKFAEVVSMKERNNG